MSVFNYIFTLLFLILGGLLWCLLLLIVCIGAVGIIRIMLMSVFDFDFVKWWKSRKTKEKRKEPNKIIYRGEVLKDIEPEWDTAKEKNEGKVIQ